MLRHLHIRNFALIEELDVDFSEGFSVITGETGAGKSILLGAIGLILGQRADTQSVKEGAAKCVIEATFGLRGYALKSFFDENDFDYDEDACVLRRELTAAGKSRAYINDSPATLQQMKQLGDRLIDIHSQHQNLLLRDQNFQLNILDTMAGTEQELHHYRQLYAQLREAEQTLAEAIESTEKHKAEADYLDYQLQQLHDFDPQAGEDSELEEEQRALSHAEDIKTALFRADALLSEADEAIIPTLRTARNTLQEICDVFPRVESLAERIDSAYIDLKDVSEELASLAEDIEYNPARLDQVNARLDQLYTLQKKHGVQTAAELEALMHDIESRLQQVSNAEEQIAALQQNLSQVKALTKTQADKLTNLRRKKISDVQKIVKQRLEMLGMTRGILKIDLTQTELRPDGQDRATFLFSANEGSTPRPIADVASGGEVSRLMLALKDMTTERRALPTLVFDEIDTGVSGRIAEGMAQIMERMAGADRQVIAITHLPQIAARGQNHYAVYKEESENQTRSHIRRLQPDERVMEIAHMLSGKNVTAAAISNAKELLSR